MPHAIHLPHADDVQCAPELAALTLLEAAAYVASLALGTAHPELQDRDEFDETHELMIALAIMNSAGELIALVNRYRLALVLARERQFDFPF